MNTAVELLRFTLGTFLHRRKHQKMSIKSMLVDQPSCFTEDECLDEFLDNVKGIPGNPKFTKRLSACYLLVVCLLDLASCTHPQFQSSAFHPFSWKLLASAPLTTYFHIFSEHHCLWRLHPSYTYQERLFSFVILPSSCTFFL